MNEELPCHELFKCDTITKCLTHAKCKVCLDCKVLYLYSSDIELEDLEEVPCHKCQQ